MATRATMRDYARLRADQVDSTYPTDTQYNTYLDKAASTVWRKFVKAGWKPGQTITTVTANGATSYALPTTIHLVEDVARLDGTTRIPIPRVKPEDKLAYKSRGNGPAEVYDLIDGVTAAMKIIFYPVPTSGSYEVTSTNTFAGFTADGDLWLGPDGSSDLVSLGAALMGMKREATNWQDLTDEYQELYESICETAGWLSSQDPPTVRDVRKIRSVMDAFDYNVSEAWW